jgi:alkylation response protein AidB-like acyl-CoA dehydrogenase
MDFGFSEEQDLLRSSVRRFLDERCPLEEVRRLSETSPGYCDAQWAELAALGWPTTVIGGGTANIQKNIIAERMLGLPKD